MGGSEHDIKKLCPNANVLSGLAIEAAVLIEQTKKLQNS